MAGLAPWRVRQAGLRSAAPQHPTAGLWGEFQRHNIVNSRQKVVNLGQSPTADGACASGSSSTTRNEPVHRSPDLASDAAMRGRTILNSVNSPGCVSTSI